jgi:hypothetical protein
MKVPGSVPSTIAHEISGELVSRSRTPFRNMVASLPMMCRRNKFEFSFPRCKFNGGGVPSAYLQTWTAGELELSV